uniref:Ig-like domain-containing protein n=1 Tax=Cyprinus carpio TaxID=7962 RepID=A0A8C2CJR7_CYPCA
LKTHLFHLYPSLFPFSVSGLIVKGPSGPLVAPLGSSVVLPCSVDELLSVKDLEVEWRRTDPETLVHLYQDGESRPEVQQQDYRDRAHFFTDQIQRGNFSLRLDNLRAEDKGQYKCKVYIQQESGETAVEIKVNVGDIPLSFQTLGSRDETLEQDTEPQLIRCVFMVTFPIRFLGAKGK